MEAKVKVLEKQKVLLERQAYIVDKRNFFLYND